MLSENHELNPARFSNLSEMLEQLGIQEEMKHPSCWLGNEIQSYSHYSANDLNRGHEAKFEDDSQAAGMYVPEKMEILKDREILPAGFDVTFNPCYSSSYLRREVCDMQTDQYFLANCAGCLKSESEEYLIRCDKCQKNFCIECCEDRTKKLTVEKVCKSCNML